MTKLIVVYLCRGKLCFWDGDSGTSIASHQSHKADVLCICLDEQQTTVYAAGKPNMFQRSVDGYKDVRVSVVFGKYCHSKKHRFLEYSFKKYFVCVDSLVDFGKFVQVL